MGTLDMPGIELIKIENPFDRTRRRVSTISCESQTLADIVRECIPISIGVHISINGRIIPENEWHLTYPQIGEQIVFVPIVAGGGDDKQILNIILMIAVVWAAPMVVGALLPGLTVGGLAYVFATAGVMLAGGLLVSALLPAPQPKQLDIEEISQIYGWNPQTTQRQGLVVPKFYGKNKLFGNVIAAHTEVSGVNTQLLKMLICLGEGPIESVSDIKLNDQPIANYSDVSTETRLGLVDQTMVSFFSDTKPEFRPNIKVVNSSPRTYSTPDDDFDDIEVDILFPRGIYWANDQGGMSNHGIGIKVEVSKYQAGNWTTIGEETITNNNTNRQWKTYKASDSMTITRGEKYDIKATKTTADKGVRYGDDVYLGGIREIFNDNFQYPKTALVGINALATDQLSGALRFSCLSEGAIIDTYNGTSWTLQYSDNPAWVLYDILTQPVISGDGGGIPYAIERYDGIHPPRIDYAKFYELAVFCSQADIPDGKGGVEERVTFNGGFDAKTTMWEAALKVCEIARCVLIWNGVELTLAIDKAADPVQMFTVGNIQKDSFQETFLPEKDRASEIELRYKDADQDYKLTPSTIFNTAINNPASKVTLELFGITKQSEAWRAGMYRLAQNQLLKTTINFEADIDAIACTVGDVVYVQHDVPEWGQGGRVVSATNNTITIDKEVSPSDGIDQVMIRVSHDDTIETKTVVAIIHNSGQSTLTISGTWTTNPARDDIYAFGQQNLVAKKFRIVGFERSGDQRCLIRGIEYNAGIYANDPLAPTLPAPNVTPSGTDATIRSPNWEDMISRLPQTVIRGPAIDAPMTTNLQWNDNTPGAGSVSWSKADGTNPILFTIGGSTHEITPDNTDKKWIWWDPAISATAFQSSDTQTDAVGSSKWPVCFNIGGISDPTWGQRMINTEKVIDNAITVPNSSYTDGDILFTSAAWVEIQTITFTSIGMPVHILCIFLAKAPANNNGKAVRLKRNGDIIYTQGPTFNRSDTYILSGFGYVDTPDAGVITYAVEAKGDGAGGNFIARERGLRILELKK